MNSFEIFKRFEELNLLKNSPFYWWPNYGSFEVIVGAILTQNTKWQNVEHSLNKLRERDLLDLDKLANIDVEHLSSLIQKSGFKNQKSKRIKLLSKNIIKDFKNFENFKNNVSREWLLNQKGIGFETCDAILCYACGKEIMVVDSYTNKVLKSLGFEFESYSEIVSWLEYGINENYDKIVKIFGYKDLNLIFARFHGGFVEFCKIYCKRGSVDTSKLL